jgi:TIR domain
MPTDYFVSYTSTDKAWAEWIAWVLEEDGATTKIQAWDFMPGSNFVLEMQRAATESARTLALLSPDYLKSQFGAPEWAAAFATDPEGYKRRLVPVRIRECRPDGLLAAVVYIDLVGTSETDAQQVLLKGLRGQRAKPSKRPSFPGSGQHTQRQRRPVFPGARVAVEAATKPQRYMPSLKKSPSDLDKRRFVDQTFETIAQHFDRALAALSAHDARIEHEAKRVTPIKYVAELFR